MLRCLSPNSDAPFLATRWCTLVELSALAGTCRAWRGWMAEPAARHVPTVAHCASVTCAQLLRMDACPWLERHNLVELCMRGGSSVELDELLRTRELTKKTLRRVFERIGGRLRRLTLDVARSAGSTKLCDALLRALIPLQQLEELSLQHCARASAVQLHKLPRLPKLSAFSLRSSGAEADDRFGHAIWHPSAEQVACLAQCRRLERLDCGSWSPASYPPWEQETISEEVQAQEIATGIGALLRAWTHAWPAPLDAPASPDAHTAEHASAAAAVPEPALLPAQRLRSLQLSSTEMSPAVWAHVAQLTQVESLTPLFWEMNLYRQDAPSVDWSHLRAFRRLTELTLNTSDVEQSWEDKAARLHGSTATRSCRTCCTAVRCKRSTSAAASCTSRRRTWSVCAPSCRSCTRLACRG
jgi:hypothetical protein